MGKQGLAGGGSTDELIVEPGVAQTRFEPHALEVLNVFATRGTTEILHGISFCVPAGEVVAIIGPNGSGKTTLLDCIGGQLACSGFIRMAGWDIWALRPHRRVALGLARTFQSPVVIPELDVLTNMIVGAEHWQSHRAAVARATETAEQLGIGWLLKRPLASLNHADRRLVEIGRALTSDPRVLLLDEPTAGFSHDEGLHLCRLIVAAARERACTVVLVEHDVPLVMAVASRVIALNQGHVIAHGLPSCVQRDPCVIECYLGPPVQPAAASSSN